MEIKGLKMARPPKSKSPDLSESQDLTAGLIDRLTCPTGKQQAFLRDCKAPGLRVRVTAAGAKSFVFEAKLNRQTIRRTIGDVRAWPIDAARIEANRLRVTLDGGTDPRELELQQQAIKAADKAAAAVRAVTVAEVWAVYLDERKRHWGDRHYRDHLKLSDAGGEPFKRGRGTTLAGPLAPLMPLLMPDLTAALIETWAANEAQTRPTQARLAWRLLKVFLGWCNEQPAYAGILTGNPAKTKKARESLGRPGVKSEVLQKGQVSAWFAAVQKIGNPAISAYLQTILLTGARPGEVMQMRWDDLNVKWMGLTIRDKVEGERAIPLTPYVWHILSTLTRRNEWIFSSQTSKSGHLTEPTHPHAIACKVAGLGVLTLHGLRRSFKSLTEWLEVPVGVVAQIQGHKPSATAEKHCTVRPLELLAVHHNRIEAWVLEQAGIVFDAKASAGALSVVS